MKMRYWTEAKYSKYAKWYDLLSFARKFGDTYGKKLMDTPTKTGIDAAKSASKQVIQKTSETTGDLIGSKIADKTTSVGKRKNKEKENEGQGIYILPEKRQQIIDDVPIMVMYLNLLLKNG